MSATAIVAAPAAHAGAATHSRDSASGVPVIWDTDIYSSFDDGGAEVTLLALQLEGLDHVIAMGVDTRTSRPAVATASWRCVAAIAQYMGFPNIPIGSDMPDNGPTPTEDNFIGPCAADASAHTPSPQSAVEVYRRALAAEPDGSVIIVGTGYEENFENLLKSSPDANSPLDGEQLVAAKVKELVVTGGGFPTNAGENNFVGNAGAARYVVANWPTKIVYSGYEVGSNVVTGGNVTSTMPANDPVRAAMLAYVGANKAITSYDLTTAYHAIEPNDASLTEVGPGTVSISTVGADTFTAGPGDDYYLQLNNTTSLESTLNHFWTMLPGHAGQGLAFTSTPPGTPMLGQSYQAGAGPGASGNPVTLTIDPASTSGCTIGSSGLVTFAAPAGTCVIDAQEPGTTYYAPAFVQQSLTVAKDPQTITFTSAKPSSPTVGSTYTPTATGGASGNPVVMTIDKTSTSGCRIAGGMVTFTAPLGTCVIDANQSGNATYAAANQAQQTVTVNGDPQTVTFKTTPPTDPKVGGPRYRPAATASSGLPVTFSIAPTSHACTIAGGVVSFVAAGTCVVDANQAGSAIYDPEMTAQAFGIHRGTTVIRITTRAPARAQVGQSYLPRATSSSGDTVVIGLGAKSTGCSVAKGVVRFRAVGTCVITFNDHGNANWAPAAPQHQVIPIVKGGGHAAARATPATVSATSSRRDTVLSRKAR